MDKSILSSCETGKKILLWNSGRRVGDANTKSKHQGVKSSANSLAVTGPFGLVELIQDKKTFTVVFKWHSKSYRKQEKAVKDFSSTAWHFAIRGVLC